MLGFTSAGGGADIQQFQQGQASCTITHQSCFITVTYPTAFSQIPNHVGATWAGLDQNIGHIDSPATSIGSVTLQADAGETWTNIPVAQTEIYGLQNHEIIVNLDQVNFVDFGITCTSASATDTANFRLQYSIDGGNNGGTWHELANVAGGGDIRSGSENLCSFSTPTALPMTRTQFAIVSQVGAVELRVIGFGGAGAGDSMTISNIYINVYKDFFETPSMCILDSNAGGHSCTPFSSVGTPRTALGMTIWVIIPFQSFSNYPVDVNWYAYLCINGGTAC